MSTFANLVDVYSNEDPVALVTKDLHSPIDIIIQNIDGNSILYIGDSNVNSENFGLMLTQGMGVCLSLGPDDDLWVTSNDWALISVLKTTGKGR